MTARHLLTLTALDPDSLRSLLDRAAHHHDAIRERKPFSPSLEGSTLANLFLEPSTRTRLSFELAARRLGAGVVNLDIDRSSSHKGESLADTVRTINAMGVELFAIRHGRDGELAALAEALADTGASVVSAGEGRSSHPTQGLIDALTVRQRFGRLEGLTIAIAGDVAHSRVARSAIEVFAASGAAEIRIGGPDGFLPDDIAGVHRCDTLDDTIAGADVVMMLRVQHERIEGSAPDAKAYHAGWGLTAARLDKAAPHAVVMHPGPFNRGIEIDSEVADGERSLILQQVANGVPVRMAVLEWLKS